LSGREDLWPPAHVSATAVLAGEGMVELYGELQPILDPVMEIRREAAEREDAAEEDDVKADRIAVAVVGVPNAVSPHPNALYIRTSIGGRRKTC
jgi:hypothetical protein